MAPSEARPVELENWSVFEVAGASYPVLQHEPGARAAGLLIQLEDAEQRRLDHYESAFGYEPSRLTSTSDDHDWLVYLPPETPAASGRTWSLEEWSGVHAARAIEAANEVMEYFERPQALRLEAMRPMIEARAWSRRLAQAGRTKSGDATSERVHLDGREIRHAGFYRFDEYRLRHRRFDGSLSSALVREVFIGSDAALVLPYDAVLDEVVVIEQFRVGPFARSDPSPWVYEPIAGLVDAGEDPADTARREAIEEAGLVLERLTPITGVYPSPGGTTDFFHCFLGHCRLDRTESWLGGQQEEGEDIRAHRMPLDRALAMVDAGEIRVAPLAMMLLWLARHRDRIRAA